MNKVDNLPIFNKALKATIPVFLGYMAIGIAFGMLMVKQGYPWYLSVIMSIVIYAGAGQYIAVGLFAAGTGLMQTLLITFLVNCRHMIYGISLFEKFKNIPKHIKLYLIFSLTDETYALLTTINPVEIENKSRFYFFIALLNQFYWILGTLLGAIAGSLIPFDFKGIDFALTALFSVLFVEQVRTCDSKIPFILAGFSGILGILINKENMLIISITIYLISLFFSRKYIESKEEFSC